MLERTTEKSGIHSQHILQNISGAHKDIQMNTKTMKLTTHLHTILSLGMYGDLPSPCMPSWHGVQLHKCPLYHQIYTIQTIP